MGAVLQSAVAKDRVVPFDISSAAVSSPPKGKALRHAMAMVTVAWLFGSVWSVAISGTPLTLFARGLKASNFEFGLLAAMPFIASFLSLPASLLSERTGDRKRIFLWSLFPNRFLWIAIPLIPLAILHYRGAAGEKMALMSFLVLLFAMHTGQAIGSPAWTSWMGDLVPDRVRGRYFCRRRQWGIVSIIPAAIIVGYVLDHYAGGGAAESMNIVAIIFMIAAVFGCADIALFFAVPSIPKAPQRGTTLIRSFKEPLHNKQFMWFAAFVGLMMFAVASQGQFVTLYLTQKLGIANLMAQSMLLVAPLLAQLVMLPIWGLMADRVGKKPMLAIGSLSLVPIGLGWVFVTKDAVWLGFVLSMLGAAMWAALEIANFNLVLEMSSDEDGRTGGSSYAAINSVIINLSGCAGGLVFGLVAQWLKDWTWRPIASIRPATFYDVLFVSSALLRLLAAMALLPLIVEPSAKPTREALRFMTANIYNNLFNAMMLPARMLRIGKKESYPEADELKALKRR